MVRMVKVDHSAIWGLNIDGLHGALRRLVGLVDFFWELISGEIKAQHLWFIVLSSNIFATVKIVEIVGINGLHGTLRTWVFCGDRDD